jgi:hypothetical protein
LSIAEKNRVLKSQIPRLVNDIKSLQPENIIILKTNLFAPVKSALEEAGFGERILNKKPIPFPSNWWQAAYPQLLQGCINQGTYNRPKLKALRFHTGVQSPCSNVPVAMAYSF